jgi:hypothetical protein
MKRNKQILSGPDLISKLIFIPESPILVINMLRKLIKWLFQLIGRLAAIILL